MFRNRRLEMAQVALTSCTLFCKNTLVTMERDKHDLMDVDGIHGELEAFHSPQGDTIPSVQTSSFGEFVTDEGMFLRVEEAIGVRQTLHAMRGTISPIM